MSLSLQTTEETSANFTDLFRTLNLRKKTLIQWFLWFTCSFVYYGLVLNTSTLIPGGDFHINFFIGGVVEIPAYLLTIMVLLYWGRRLPLSGMFFLCGLCYIIVVCTPGGKLNFYQTFGLYSTFQTFVAEHLFTCYI